MSSSTQTYKKILIEVGNATKLQAAMELGLRDVYQTLAAPGFGVFLHRKHNSYTRVAEDTIDMLKLAGLTKVQLKACIDCIKASTKLNKERDSVVHSLIVNSEKSVEVFHLSSMKPQKKRDWTLADFKSICSSLYRMQFRINYISLLLNNELDFYKSAGIRPYFSSEFLVKVINDGFELNKKGGLKLPRNGSWQ